MIWATLSGFGVAAVLGWLLLRARTTIGKLKVENAQLLADNERKARQLNVGKPSDSDIDKRMREADGNHF